jgi:thymidine kinase
MSLEVILGTMFASKSSNLIQAYNRFCSIGYKVFVLTSALDNRYHRHSIASHDGSKIEARPITSAKGENIRQEYKEANAIIIDEAQFIGDLIPFVVQAVDNDKKHVIVCGLSGDFRRRPFGDLLQLIPIADKITHLKAFCRQCGDGTLALFTKRITKEEDSVVVGTADKYVAVCRKHYIG